MLLETLAEVVENDVRKHEAVAVEIFPHGYLGSVASTCEVSQPGEKPRHAESQEHVAHDNAEFQSLFRAESMTENGILY